ncbi:MAG: DNA polymerase III subunit gamma/tau [Oscillospiraceae bacterium]|nr:DNA polymerase III subunit gamma/tau [Oscillospiraceae bacterium]
MAYLALYRKYRPQTFSEVISQPHITITLQNQIKSGQIAHAYLFTGSRGTGKTTCAKILAKAVNCVGNDAPCLTCESCLAADNSPDIQEIDAASNNGVEDIRALREEAGYLPSELKYKVYIIDEVHMLSTSAFNALLKTLEEPPPHVIFILATTEIHKIPATVLSRCQRYEFNRINSEESAAALIEIASKEGITLEKDAALLISRLSDGGMRDALSLLDVAAADSGKSSLPVTQQIVRDCAGIAGKEHLFAITDAIANGDGKTALTVTSELYAKSKDPTRLIDELLQHFRNLMIAKLMPNDFSLLTVLQEEIPEISRQAELFSIETMMDCLDKLEDCIRLKGRKVEAEICLMRLCVERSKPATANPPPKPVPVVESPAPIAPPPPLVPPLPQPLPPIPPPVSAELSAEREIPSPIQRVKDDDFSQWQTVLEKLDAYKAAMLEETFAAVSENTLIVTGNANLGFFFENVDNLTAVEKAVYDTTGKGYKISFNCTDSAGNEGIVPPITEKPNETTRIDQFLTDVEQAGIQLSIK